MTPDELVEERQRLEQLLVTIDPLKLQCAQAPNEIITNCTLGQIAAESAILTNSGALGPLVRSNISKRGRLLLLAAVIRCTKNACSHAAQGPHLDRCLYAIVPCRFLSCSYCMWKYWELMCYHDAHLDDEMHCDFCLQDSSTFSQLRIASAGVAIFGEACPSCIQLFAEE